MFPGALSTQMKVAFRKKIEQEALKLRQQGVEIDNSEILNSITS